MIPPSLNKFAGRKNEWEYRNLKQEWKQIVALYCRPRPDKPLENVIVRLTYTFPDRRRRDPDNYSGKMVLDGLTECGIIKDDSFDCIQLELRGKYEKGVKQTQIEIIPATSLNPAPAAAQRWR
jgi:crossover junction endodeoxyribonuclease RusA